MILYFTDSQGISPGYKPIYTNMLMKVGLNPSQVMITSIYNSVKHSLKKKAANSNTWVLDPAKAGEVRAVLIQKIRQLKPELIVTSCPAILGVITEEGRGADSIELGRGGVYEFEGIKVIVVYPPAVTNRKIDDKKRDEEGLTFYSVKSGTWILLFDWARVARYAKKVELRLPAFDYSVCKDRAGIMAAVRFLTRCIVIAEDIETGGARETAITCVGFTGMDRQGRVKTYVIPFSDRFKESGVFWDTDAEFAFAIRAVRVINKCRAYKVMQNGSYDCSYFIRDTMPVRNYLLDSLHMWHSIYPELPKKLNFIASMLLDNFQYWKDDIKGMDAKDESKRDQTMDRYWRYNGLDCYYTLFCALRLIPMVATSPELTHNYHHEFMQMLGGLTMSLRGMKADKQRLREHEVELEASRSVALARLRVLTDDAEFNPDSPAQKQSLLYEVLGATKRDDKGKPIGPGSKKTPSAGASAMKLIKTEHPIFRIFCEAIEDVIQPRKQISDICHMPLYTPRFRTAFSAAGTETWRFSSKKSNFWDGSNAQNITKKMRDWLTADDGFLLFDVDFSQSDAVYVAYESNDPAYIETMSSGKDSHAIHAAHFFKSTYESVVAGKRAGDPLIVHPTKGIRSLTKRVVHGANFQMMAGTLYVTMGREAVEAAATMLGHKGVGDWTDDQLIMVCSTLLQEFRRLYPRLQKKGWYGEIAGLLQSNNKKLTNAFGMTRKFMGDPADQATQREATAFYGQSDTAGNMNRSLEEILFGYIPPSFRDGANPHRYAQPLPIDPLMVGHDDFGIHTLLQVHDSFVGQINLRAPRWKEGLNNLLTIMQRPCIINGHEVSVPVEMEIGRRWSKGMIQWNPNDISSIDRIAATTFK